MAKNNKNHSTTYEKGIEEKANPQLEGHTPESKDINPEGNAAPKVSPEKTEDTGSKNEDPKLQEPKDINPEGITNSEVSLEKTEDTESKNEDPELQETKDINPEVSPEKTEADQSEETKNYDSEAKELMDKNHIKQIWRCPVTGYWFTSDVYAEEQKKRTGKSLEFYKL
jgi:rubrerythrin